MSETKTPERPVPLRRQITNFVAIGSALLVLTCIPARFGEASAQEDCRPAAAAGKPPPAPADQGPANAFRILWHVGTQIEDLADRARDADVHAALADIQKEVNGYYFLKLGPGSWDLAYWPGRPPQCALNFRGARDELGRAATANIQKSCDARFMQSFAASNGADPKAAAGQAYFDALSRVVKNLGARREQEQGKLIIGEMLFLKGDFSYDAETDVVTLERLPKTYCFLNAQGIQENNVLLYQETAVQIRHDALVWVPTIPGQRTGDSRPGRDSLPNNGRIVNLVGRAFADSSVPLRKFSINIRRWSKRNVVSFERDLKGSKYFGGFFFEGGTGLISPNGRDRLRIDNFADGIAWILANTDQRVFLLMPGFWEKEEASRLSRATPEPGDVQKQDELIARLRTLITSLNDKIGHRLGSTNETPAICNKRIYFIPASYGGPAHVKTLPAKRSDGALAGTVTGQILLLAEMRKTLCGAGTP